MADDADTELFEATKILLKIEMVADSNQYDHDCLINLNRSVKITASMVEEVVYDCDDPSKPGVVYRLKDSVSLSAEGTGKTRRSSLAAYLDFLLGSASKRARIELGGAGGQALLTRLHLTDFTPAEGEPKKYASASMSFASTGAITREAM